MTPDRVLYVVAYRATILRLMPGPDGRTIWFRPPLRFPVQLFVGSDGTGVRDVGRARKWPTLAEAEMFAERLRGIGDWAVACVEPGAMARAEASALSELGRIRAGHGE